MTTRRAAARSLVVAAAATRIGYRAVDGLPPAATARWETTNFRGRRLTLLGGPAVCLGVLGALAVLPPGRLRRGAGIAALGAGLFGGIDDLGGDGSTRGLRGHLAALVDGRVTTGNLKIIGIGASALVGAGEASGRRFVAALPAGVVVALSANLANLLDLRPGRASKFAALTGLALFLAGGEGAALAAAAAGAALGELPLDLGERVMLGDTGANALGALVGMAAVAGAGPRRVYLMLAGLAAITAASEVTSFSSVIDRTPALRFVDRLGQRSGDADG